MSFDIAGLIREYPRLYHMAEEGSWPSISRNGLLSTSALLDLFEVQGENRIAIEERHRPESVALENTAHGTAVVRDQKPMSDSALQKCLTGDLTPADWYRLLNSQVFFWLSRHRLDRLLQARAYRDRRHTILELDTAQLLHDYGDRVVLAPINTGSTIMNPQPRGSDTFQPIERYPYEFWRKKRGRRDAVVELAVHGGVRDVKRFVTRVTEEGGGGAVHLIWERA